MALEINKLVRLQDLAALVAEERLCLTEDGRVVVEGHEDGRWLWKIPGDGITAEEAAKYGLSAKAEVAEETAKDEAVKDSKKKAKPKAKAAAEAEVETQPETSADEPAES